MSSVSRSTSRGGKGAKLEVCPTNKPQKTESKSESPKSLDHNTKIQPTAEQLRIAKIIERKSDDPNLMDKIKQVMNATLKTEDEVSVALHDCDNDPDRAVNMILEGKQEVGWEMSSKKKKNRQPGTTKTEQGVNNKDAEVDDWDSPSVPCTVNPEREKTRNRGGGPPRMRPRGGNDRGWRGRENKENERNLEEGRDGFRKGGRMMNGPGRFGRGGRGGNRSGPRTYQNREKGGFNKPIETWNNPGTEDNSGGDSLKMENWCDDDKDKWQDSFPSPEDWDNEEYTGSLADSKVFTPSGGTVETVLVPDPITDITTNNSANNTGPDLSTTMTSQNLANRINNPNQLSQSLDLHQGPQLTQSPVPVGMGVLNAAQTEYLSQLTQQTSENMKTSSGINSSNPGVPTSYSTSTNSYPVTSSFQSSSPPSGFTGTAVSFSSSNYGGTVNSYSNQIQDGNLNSSTSQSMQSQTIQTISTRQKPQRPRVPPPSKIPSSAVEMPDDAVHSNIGFLDVQFGALEVGNENMFDSSVDQTKYSTGVSGSVLDSIPSPRTSSNIEINSSNQNSGIDTYSSAAPTQKTSQSSITSALNQSQKLPVSDTIMQSSDHKSSVGLNQSNFTQSTRSSTTGGIDMDKSDVEMSYTAPSTVNYQSYSSQKSNSTSYQPVSSYSSNYPSTQVTSTTTYQTNQSQMSYSASGTVSGSYSSQTGVPNSYPTGSYTQASVSGTTYQTGPSYTSMTQTNSFPNPSQSYQTSGQTGYGASNLVNTGYTAGASQYQNNYGSGVATTTQNHTKLGSVLSTSAKDSQFDTTTTLSSNLSSTIVSTMTSGLSTNVNASTALGLTSTSQTVNTTSTKVTSSTGKSGVVPSIPPGVPPALLAGTHQYIMSQGGMPYFQQPVYSFEDLQLLQQRIPHLQPAGYYDLGFQAPTSLATGREGSLTNVAYSMSDGRYTRADNNASPVPSTLSQQNATQASHQQPMLNATIPYAYFYGGGMMPSNFQYGAPIYPMPPATNAHGTTNSTQYPKPASYASGYGSAYDGLSQSQDYGKTGYVSGTQSQTKAGIGGNAGTTGSTTTDLSATMYGKSHVPLGKVNSYDKQVFHSGTPPPFSLPGSQSTPMTPSGPYQQIFIPAMGPQHHTTTLMHQPLHQESGGNANPRSQSSAQPNKSGAKQGYNSTSYWNPN